VCRLTVRPGRTAARVATALATGGDVFALACELGIRGELAGPAEVRTLTPGELRPDLARRLFSAKIGAVLTRRTDGGDVELTRVLGFGI
jgi:hypothetical protein